MNWRTQCLHAAGVLAALSFSSAPALAATEDSSGFYLGVSGGTAKYDVEQEDLDDAFVFGFEQNGLFVLDGESSFDEKDTSFNFFAGYRFSPYFSLEATYVDLGSADYKGSVTATDFVDVFDVEGGASVEAKGPAVSLIGAIPFSEAVELYGRAGIFFADTTLSVDIESIHEELSGSSEDLTYGVGFAWNVNPAWTTRVEFQRFADVGDEDKTGESNIDQYSLSLLYRF